MWRENQFQKTLSVPKLFLCHKQGHLKNDFWKRKINILFDKILQQANKKEKRIKRIRNKEKEHKRISNIYKHRLKESQFIQKEDKHILTCKNLEIGIVPRAYYPSGSAKTEAKTNCLDEVRCFSPKKRKRVKTKTLGWFPELLWMWSHKSEKTRIH